MAASASTSSPSEAPSLNEKNSKVFRFHLLGEPYSLDPAQTQAIAGSYLYANIYRGLFRHTPDEGLIPEGASGPCQRQGWQKLSCPLNPNMKWSDGQPVKASQYVRSFRRLLDPNIKSIQTELLLHVKGARAVLSGDLPVTELGVSAPDDHTLLIEFETPDWEFEYKLIAPALSPVRSDEFPDRDKAHELITNGPYKIVNWRKGRGIELTPNPHYFRPSRKHLPPVEVLLIDDDSTAQRLYEHGRLSLLRRLVASEIPAFRNREDFLQISMARFDYIGFSHRLYNQPQLRKAFALAVNYPQFKDLFHAKGRPGCPSMPPALMSELHCLSFSKNEAKKSWQRVSPELRKQRWSFGFSQMGGDDIARAAEWFQNQWRKNLNARVELQPVEQGMYLQNLRANPPDIFRKGVGMDRPTCLAALEIFGSENRENYIRLKNKKFDEVLTQLNSELSPEQRKKLCTEGVKILIDNHYIIPLGEMHFSMLASPQFEGWVINELNQLDLTHLRLK